MIPIIDPRLGLAVGSKMPNGDEVRLRPGDVYLLSDGPHKPGGLWLVVSRDCEGVMFSRCVRSALRPGSSQREASTLGMEVRQVRPGGPGGTVYVVDSGHDTSARFWRYGRGRVGETGGHIQRAQCVKQGDVYALGVGPAYARVRATTSDVHMAPADLWWPGKLERDARLLLDRDLVLVGTNVSETAFEEDYAVPEVAAGPSKRRGRRRSAVQELNGDLWVEEWGNPAGPSRFVYVQHGRRGLVWERGAGVVEPPPLNGALELALCPDAVLVAENVPLGEWHATAREWTRRWRAEPQLRFDALDSEVGRAVSKDSWVHTSFRPGTLLETNAGMAVLLWPSSRGDTLRDRARTMQGALLPSDAFLEAAHAVAVNYPIPGAASEGPCENDRRLLGDMLGSYFTRRPHEATEPSPGPREGYWLPAQRKALREMAALCEREANRPAFPC